MVAAGYLIYNTNIRVKDDNGYHFHGLPDGPPVNGTATTALIQERAEAVFEMAVEKSAVEKMKTLVIVNSSLFRFELIQACVEVAERYADKVMVIPPLLARMTYALEDLATKPGNPPSDEVILVVTITTAFAEFVILRRDQNSELRVDRCASYDPSQCRQMFIRYYDDFAPHSTVLLVHKSLGYVAKRLKYEFQLAGCPIRYFKKWDYVLLFGGLYRAMDDEDGFDTRYHIPNFSSGFETKFRSEERQILLPGRSPLPCNIYGHDGKPRMITILYFREYIQKYDELVLKKRYATYHTVKATGSSKEIIGYIDERGVPYVPAPTHLVKWSGSEPTKTAKPDTPDFSYKSMHGFSNFGIFSQSSTTASNVQVSVFEAHVKFLFFDNFYAVEVYQNGVMVVLTDSAGNEKFPMYLSMAEGPPEIAQKAKNHCQKYPRMVVYDVLEVIGKPLRKIKLNPKWGFKLVERDDMVYFQVETLSGPLLISQELILAAFMKDMKLRTDAHLDSTVKRIDISTNLELTRPQKEVFKKAASKVDLEISAFVVNNVQ